MEKETLGFEAAMTRAMREAKSSMTEEQYKRFYPLMSEAWGAGLNMYAASVAQKKETTDRRFSVSLSLGFRKEG